MSDHSKRVSVTLIVFVFLVGGAVYFFLHKTQKPESAKQSFSPLAKSLKNSLQSAENTPAMPSPQKTLKLGEGASHPTDEHNPDCIKTALEALDNPDQDLSSRFEAVVALRNHPSAKAIEVLEMFLADSESLLVNEALKIIGVIGLNSEFKKLAFDILSTSAADKDFPSRGRALEYAAMFGEDDTILPLIGDYLAENTSESCALAIRAMAHISSPDCVPYLREALENEIDSETRQNAHLILAKIGTQNADDLLEGSLLSKHGDEQLGIAYALANSQNAKHHDMLANALISDTLHHDSLSAIATSQAAGMVFAKALRSQDVSKEEKLYFLDTLADTTIGAPGYIRNEVSHMLTDLLDTQDPEIKTATLETLSQVGPTEDLSNDLVPELESNDPIIKKAALKAYAQYCTPDNYKHLKTLWDDKDEEVRRTAFVLSEIFINESDLEDLEKAVKSKDEFIATQAKMMITYVTPID